MIKTLLKIAAVTGIVTAMTLACTKKKSDGIVPTYGTTGNPNPGAITVTGANSYTNPATENTSLYVGGSGWTNPTCGSTNSVTLKGNNGDIDVTLTFSGAAKNGTFLASTSAANNICTVRVLNAPGQPAGVAWVSQSGTVTVVTTSASISASLSNVACTQSTFRFPTVLVNGLLGCSQ